ncbi:MAG: pyridoxal phosphate-dependent aminotransferase [Candidatus Thalassarchaeaceae archaeon]|nr:pyridoxal phosphate-dependent aminotransferase [Candidatus Thalassarchaeaceae archaeon]
MEPRLGGPVSGNQIPPVDYLSWYVPRLQENRPHDLSQSGFAYDWDFELSSKELLGFWKSGDDPAKWVAERHNVELRQVCIAHGACQAISLAILAALPEDGPRVVGVEMPSFAVVSQSARLIGCEVIPFSRGPNPGIWKLNRDEVMDILPKVGVIALTPVMNPTGEMISEEDQDWLVDVTKKAGVNIVSDEVYLDAAKGTEFYRPMYLKSDNAVSVNSLTKTYGLGPLRFGWILGAPKIIENAKHAFQNMQGMASSPSVSIAGAVFNNLDKALDAIWVARENNLPKLLEVLKKHGIDWNPPPFGIFGAFSIDTDAVEAMHQYGKPLGLLATPGGMFHADLKNYLRVAWGGDSGEFTNAMPVLSQFLTSIQEGNA